MEEGKWETLFEHGGGGPSDVEPGTLAVICRMYLGADGPDNLETLCEALVKKEGGKNLSDAVLNGKSEEATALRQVLIDNAPSSQPVSSALSKLMDEDLADDDEEEAEEEEEEEEEEEDDDDDGGKSKQKKSKSSKSKSKEAKVEPVMRGFLKLDGDKLVWSGKWAYSKEAFEKGDKLKFKCTYTGKESKLSTKNPPNGKFSGYFMVEGKDKIPEKNTVLKFGEPNSSGMLPVDGRGSNQFGDFSMSGMYDPKSGRLSVKKMYKSPDDDFEADDLSDDESGMEDDDPDEAAAELEDLKADAKRDLVELIKRKQEVDEQEKKRKKQKQ